MSLLYTGNKAFDETEDWTIQNDEWGVDRLSRTFSGALPLLGEFLSKVKKGATDTEFQNFTVTDYTVQGHRSFPRVQVNYAGLWNNEIPQPLLSVSTEIQETVITFPPTSLTITIRYYSRTARWRYVSLTRPVARLFDGKLPPGSHDIQIVDARGSINELTSSISDQSAMSLVARGLARREVVTIGPDYDPVGKLWEVEERSTEYLMGQALAVSPRRIGSPRPTEEGEETTGGFQLNTIQFS